jgi:hypothetical protein
MEPTPLEWYNHERHHGAPGWMMLYQVREELAERLRLRLETLNAVLAAHSERFIRGKGRGDTTAQTRLAQLIAYSLCALLQ